MHVCHSHDLVPSTIASEDDRKDIISSQLISMHSLWFFVLAIDANLSIGDRDDEDVKLLQT